VDAKPRFQLKGVCKFYFHGNRPGKKSLVTALQDVHLDIHHKKIHALVGGSGCGKSTLARLLMRFEPHDRGEILYENKPIDAAPIKQFRKKNQMVFQDSLLSVNPCFNIYKILSEPLVVDKRDKVYIKEKIHRLLDVFEISPSVLRRTPPEVSGGQLQRIVLARSLVLEPEFIVLDEPFSGLDEIMAARLIRYFKRIARRLETGMLYISHNPGHVKLLADVTTRMENGRIVD
jgi:ABC-type dipeptide/oligopeptide/nickel transport system ATPase subunit